MFGCKTHMHIIFQEKTHTMCIYQTERKMHHVTLEDTSHDTERCIIFSPDPLSSYMYMYMYNLSLTTLYMYMYNPSLNL